jgi:maleate isomerase
MYGDRARIGYTCPIYLAEVFPLDFYRIVPEGVSLVTATASVWEGTQEEMAQSAQQTLRAAREMARAGVNIVVLGGVPVGFAAGFATTEELVKHVQDECGVQVTASLLCQNRALQAVGAKNVVVLRHGVSRDDRHMRELEALGLHIIGSRGTRDFAPEPRGQSSSPYGTPIPASATLEMARALLKENPDADTLHCPSPHWPIVTNIEALEQEFRVNVITAGQAITWAALRACGITDSISGFGRLLRDL